MHLMNITKPTYIICIILVMCLLTGCFVKKKDFYTYRYPVVGSDVKVLLRTDGFYAPLLGKTRVLFLYENGIVKEGPWVKNFFSNPSDFLDIINEDYYTQKGKEFYGCFMIKDSSLIIQIFNHHTQHNPFYRRWVFESRGVLLSDTSFVLHTNFEHLNYHEFYKEPVIFMFVPFENKPNSSNSWFNNKLWYKRNLHESRR